MLEAWRDDVVILVWVLCWARRVWYERWEFCEWMNRPWFSLLREMGLRKGTCFGDVMFSCHADLAVWGMCSQNFGVSWKFCKWIFWHVMRIQTIRAIDSCIRGALVLKVSDRSFAPRLETKRWYTLLVWLLGSIKGWKFWSSWDNVSILLYWMSQFSRGPYG